MRATAWVTQLRLRKTAKRSMWFSSHNVYYVKLMKYPATAAQMLSVQRNSGNYIEILVTEAG